MPRNMRTATAGAPKKRATRTRTTDANRERNPSARAATLDSRERDGEAEGDQGAQIDPMAVLLEAMQIEERADNAQGRRAPPVGGRDMSGGNQRRPAPSQRGASTSRTNAPAGTRGRGRPPKKAPEPNPPQNQSKSTDGKRTTRNSRKAILTNIQEGVESNGVLNGEVPGTQSRPEADIKAEVEDHYEPALSTPSIVRSPMPSIFGSPIGGSDIGDNSLGWKEVPLKSSRVNPKVVEPEIDAHASHVPEALSIARMDVQPTSSSMTTTPPNMLKEAKRSLNGNLEKDRTASKSINAKHGTDVSTKEIIKEKGNESESEGGLMSPMVTLNSRQLESGSENALIVSDKILVHSKTSHAENSIETETPDDLPLGTIGAGPSKTRSGSGVVQNEVVEAPMDMELVHGRKRKNEEVPTEPSKRQCPTPKKVFKRSFVAYVTTSTRQSAEEFYKTLEELRLIESVDSNEVIFRSCFTHQHQPKPDLWCVTLFASGELCRKLDEILFDSNPQKRIDEMNKATYGDMPTKRVHFTRGYTQRWIAHTSFVLLLKRIVDLDNSFDTRALALRYGRPLETADAFREVPEASKTAYESVNRFAREQIRNVLGPDAHLLSNVKTEAMEELCKAFDKLNGPEAAKYNSVLKRTLTLDVIERLRSAKTRCGKSLMDCVAAGINNAADPIGVYAIVPEAYHRFDYFFNKVIWDLHKFGTGEKQPAIDLGDGRDFPALDPEGLHILSTRIRCVRSVKGYPFLPSIKKGQLLELEGCLRGNLTRNKDEDLLGKYFSLGSKDTPPSEKQYFTSHFLSNGRNSKLKNAGALSMWPAGRGFFRNHAKTFMVFVNVEDHVRMESTESGSDVGRVLSRLNSGLKGLSYQLNFIRNGRLGWLTLSPTNLGSTIRASVKLRLPNLATRGCLGEQCSKLNIRLRKFEENGRDSIYIVSNEKILGISERAAIEQMYTGVKELLRMEREDH